MHDLIIIGKGYWGSAAALEARTLGYDVVVIDDEDPRSGSRNASGIAHRKTYLTARFKKLIPDDWTQGEIDRSFRWIEDNVGANKVIEHFRNDFYGIPLRPSGPAHIVDNDELSEIVPTDIVGTVARISANTVIMANSDSIKGRRIVLAAGYRTDEVLIRSRLTPTGVRPLRGRGLVIKGTPMITEFPTEVMIAPYLKHTVRRWGDLYHVGDTAERQEHDKIPDSLTRVVHSCFRDYRIVRVLDGYRPVTDQFIARQWTPHLMVTTGGNRLGLGLSGLIADRVLRWIQ